jgi:hypothetical protein
MFGLFKKSSTQMAEMMYQAILKCKLEMDEENPLGFTSESSDHSRSIICSSIFWSLLGQHTLTLNSQHEEKTFEANVILSNRLIENFHPISELPAYNIIVSEEERETIFDTHETQSTFGEILPDLILQRGMKLHGDLIYGAINDAPFGLLVPAANTLINQITGNDGTNQKDSLAVRMNLKWMHLTQTAIRAG